MNIKVTLFAISLLISSFAFAQSNKVTLKVGDPAPPIKVFKWIKGTPVESFDKNKLYVLEFWATWCGPCKAAMPHLSEVSRKYAGKVTIIGVDIWEKKGQPQEIALPAVTSFVKQMGKDMDYTVAMDNNNEDMANNWMRANGQSGIPATFLVKDGKIAWIGHPMNLDQTLNDVFSGKFNGTAFADDFNKKKDAQRKEQAEVAALLSPIQEAKKAKDYLRVLKLVDTLGPQIVARFPVYKGGLENLKFEALAETDIAAAITFAKEWHKSNPGFANPSVPMLFSQKNGLPREAYELGVAYMTELLSTPNAVVPLCQEIIAKCYYKMGDQANAVATQKKAIELAKEALKDGKYKGSILEETIAKFQASLNEYESGKQ